MENENQTVVIEFLFTAFPHFQKGGFLFFILLLFIYLFIIIGNSMVFVAVILDSRLHTPMYFFIGVLAFLEIWYTTTTIPKMLTNLISEQKTISIAGCLLQMYFFHSIGITEVYLLTTMAMDRYLAICYPLRYPTIMTSQLYIRLTLGCCFFGFFTPLPEIAWISTLPFCGPNQINNIFCDFDPILNLACVDTTSIVLIKVVDIVHAMEIISAISLVTLAYIRILGVILRIRSSEGRHKAFSTCASHLAIFLTFFGSVALMYLRFNAKYSFFWDTTITLMFAVLSPFFNPIIYSLRNKEIKGAIKKYMCQSKIFTYYSS
ncbi:olfactory receptor 6K6-like [Trichosurus vulpecula]|uniref:olfactory receptor 6K6-like n=1 Tax=Trichosurus vulpecula TaxID=9337 RepID=UPI00186B0D61|nr:olfactory receptor 6K6-like [Trichosurus vulpecula]